ncbi:MAG: arginine decarboxylase, partial [Phormidesmis sp.]
FALMSRTLSLADQAYKSLKQLPKLKALQPSVLSTNLQHQTKIVGDRTRLTVDVSGLGLTGFAADDILHQRFSVTAELPTLRQLTFIISLGNTSDDITQIISGFESL